MLSEQLSAPTKPPVDLDQLGLHLVDFIRQVAAQGDYPQKLESLRNNFELTDHDSSFGQIFAKFLDVLCCREKDLDCREATHQTLIECIQLVDNIDPKTGLLGRRKFEDASETDQDTDAIVVMVDMNGVKEKNDLETHAGGDAYIGKLAHVVKNHREKLEAYVKCQIRWYDCFRWAGDEFILILRGTQSDDIPNVRRRIQKMMRDFGVYCCVGAAYKGESTLEECRLKADQDLTKRKERRRMRFYTQTGSIVVSLPPESNKARIQVSEVQQALEEALLELKNSEAAPGKPKRKAR